MITEERALRLLGEANPIPDIDSLELHPLEGTRALEDLELRRERVMGTETKQSDSKGQRPAVRWLAVAVIVAVAGLALLLATRDGDEIAETTPTTVAEVTPTTAESSPTTDSVVETTIDAAEEAWLELPILVGPNPLPRTYRTSAFEPSFSVEIRSGWRSAPPEANGEFTLTSSTEFDRLEGVEPANGIYFREFGFGSVEETIQGFNSGFAAINLSVSPLGSTSIGGAEGQLLEISPRSQSIQCCDEDGGATMLFHQGKRYLAHVVDVNGTGVAVIVQAPDDDFDSFQERAQRILDTIIWKDLG